MAWSAHALFSLTSTLSLGRGTTFGGPPVRGRERRRRARESWHDCSRSPGGLAAVDGNSAFGKSADRSGIEASFAILDTFVQAGLGVARQNGNGFLGNDRPAVDTLIDEMDGAAGHLDSIIQSLLPSLQSRKRRKQRGMDIHDSTG